MTQSQKKDNNESTSGQQKNGNTENKKAKYDRDIQSQIIHHGQFAVELVVRWGEQIDSKAYNLISAVAILTAVLSAFGFTQMQSKATVVPKLILASMTVALGSAILALFSTIPGKERKFTSLPDEVLEEIENNREDCTEVDQTDQDKWQRLTEGLVEVYSDEARSLNEKSEKRTTLLKLAFSLLIASICILISAVWIWIF